MCETPAGSGTASKQMDRFQPTGDLPLICSGLMIAAGPRLRRAQQTRLNQYAFTIDGSTTGGLSKMRHPLDGREK